VLRGAVEELLKPPSSEEAGWGFTTAIPRDATVLGTSIAGGTATIDLSGAFDDDDGSAGMVLRLAQLVHTATQFAAVERVALRLDGNPIAAFSAEGIELPETMTRADFENQAPAILVESPLPGQAVSAPFTVRGSANTFEATVEWDLRSFDNTRLNSGFTTATCGTGCRGTFSFVVAPIEDGSVTLRLFERSAEDGSVGKLVRVPLSVG
jgi:hypothetical protein